MNISCMTSLCGIGGSIKTSWVRSMVRWFVMSVARSRWTGQNCRAIAGSGCCVLAAWIDGCTHNNFDPTEVNTEVRRGCALSSVGSDSVRTSWLRVGVSPGRTGCVFEVVDFRFEFTNIRAARSGVFSRTRTNIPTNNHEFFGLFEREKNGLSLNRLRSRGNVCMLLRNENAPCFCGVWRVFQKSEILPVMTLPGQRWPVHCASGGRCL